MSALKRPNLVDGVARNKAHPAMFEIPSAADKAKIKVGDHVKVSVEFPPVRGCNAERFWAKITDIRGPLLTAEVDNDMIFTATHGLKLGDKIALTPDNVLSTL